MSDTVRDPVLRSLAAVRREQDQITKKWLTGLLSSGAEHATHDETGEAAARLVAAVCDRLTADNGRSSQHLSGDVRAQPSGRGGSGSAAALRLPSLHAVLLESAAAELKKVPGASLDDAFKMSAAIAEAVAGVVPEVTDSAPPASDSGGAERFETFARTIAHELKNPLGAARGAAEMLATGEALESEEDRVRFAQLVLRNVNRALELLDDVRAEVQIAAPPGASDAQEDSAVGES